MDRKNINRGFKKLRVWQDAVSLYVKEHPFVWECHDCHEGAVIPGTYKNIHGEIVKIDPKNLDPDTEVMRL